jgi:hypothetical protein
MQSRIRVGTRTPPAIGVCRVAGERGAFGYAVSVFSDLEMKMRGDDVLRIGMAGIADQLPLLNGAVDVESAYLLLQMKITDNIAAAMPNADSAEVAARAAVNRTFLPAYGAANGCINRRKIWNCIIIAWMSVIGKVRPGTAAAGTDVIQRSSVHETTEI